MNCTVTYDQERTIGGSPSTSSFKEYVRTGPNSAQFSGEINDLAGWFYSSTPCLHHDLKGFATVVCDPPMESYLCEIIVAREVVETARRRVRASNGVQWQITNHAGAKLQQNLIQIGNVTSMGHRAKIPVSHNWMMEIPHDERTMIAGALISGGFNIPPFNFVTFLRDVRRVNLKFDINWKYWVIPRGGYSTGADGSKIFKPITEVISVLEVGARSIKREEPEFLPEPDEPYEVEPSETRYGPKKLKFGEG